MKTSLIATLLLGTLMALESAMAWAQRPESQPETRPGTALVATFAGGRHATGWIPIDLDLGAYIYLRARVNGVETDVVLDTGAGATVVDQGFAEKLGLETKSDVMAKGVGGVQRAQVLSGIEVDLGAITMKIPSVVGMDLAKVAARLGRPMPAILGKDVFEALVVDIDYPRARLAFAAPASFSYAGPGHTVPLFATDHGHRLVELDIEGLGPAKFMLDTGSGATIDLFKPWIDEHALLDRRAPVSTREARAVGGGIVSKVATLKSVRFAGYEVADVPAGFTQDARGGAFDMTGIAGNLGAAFFSRFRMVLDYSRSRLHVEPAEDWKTRPFRKDRIGLSGDFDDACVTITHVAAGSPAEKAGWKSGQRIKALDGEVVSARTWRHVMEKLALTAAGAEVSVMDCDGEVRKLVAADYY